MTYRELQTALKNLRNAGYDIQVKLNASLEALKAEYERLTAIQDQPTFQQQIELEAEPKTSSKVNLTYPNNLPKNEPYSHQKNSQSCVEKGFEYIQSEPRGQYAQTDFDSLESLHGRTLAITVNDSPEQPEQAMTTNQFNEWVGLPYESSLEPVVDITLEHTQELAISAIAPEPEESREKVSPPSEPIDNYNKLPSKQHEALQGNSLYITSEPITPVTKQPSNSPQDCQGYDHVKDVGLRAKSSYWIDGTELGQNLNHTQAQALRNLEDGINWLVKLPGRLKAFESGFREGLKKVDRLRQTQPSQPQVIPIHSKRRQPVPMAA